MPLMPAEAVAPAGEFSIVACAPGTAPTTLKGCPAALGCGGAGALTRTTLPAVCLGPVTVGVTAVLMMGGVCLGIGSGGAVMDTVVGCVGSCTSGCVGRLGMAS